MVEDLLDLDYEGEDRPVTLDDHVVEERRIGHQPRPAIDAQCVAATRNQEDQADMRVGQHILVSVGAPVSGPFGEGDGRLVDHIRQLSRRSPFGDTSHAVSSAVAIRQTGDAASHCRSSSCSVPDLVGHGSGTPI